ncbi:MAG: hypothetical protein IJ711_06395 [Lachnospiraceae bacterium]|nr:hypothetical protein [Lachnospiraceae bacterium]
MASEGAHPDAPVWLKVRFAERLDEFFEDAAAYQGWISKSWIQEEQIHIDVLPAEYSFERRFAFRYVEIEVLDISSKFALVITDAQCRAVSSADDDALLPYQAKEERFSQLDRIAVRTLHECMQRVFEDGPKRDRRLWMGDLRIEALANYETYRQNNLVKQGLYLFAGDTLPDGQVSANMFIEPEIEADDVAMFDYSLFFVAALRDYVRQTGDDEALRDLYKTAMRQIELASHRLNEEGVIADSDQLGWCFLDWNLNLNKQAGAHGVYLYALKAAMELSELYGDFEEQARLEIELEERKRDAQRVLWDDEQGVFVSGAQRQISWASQCFLILGDAVSREEGIQLLERMETRKDAEQMVTPYMYHHYVEALLYLGMEEKAKQVLMQYWGSMAEQGADTFWELYNPKAPSESPYGGTIVLSYCHAWSCAPAYFIRKYQW